MADKIANKHNPDHIQDDKSENSTREIKVNNQTADTPRSDQKGTRERKYKLYTFLLIALLQIFVNYDNGVIPVMLNWIQEPYNFTSTELGLTGSLSYFAFVVMSPFIPYILLNYSSQNSIALGLFLNLLSLGAFGLSVNKYMFFLSKFCIGATQSLFTTFYPIWVDTYAPAIHRNLWLSVLQGGIVVGMTIGYVSTSLYSFLGERGWRYSMLTQTSCQLILTVLFYLIPNEFVNFDPSRDERVNFDLCTCEKSECVSTMEIDTKNPKDENVHLMTGLGKNNEYDVKRCQSSDLIVSRVSSLGLRGSKDISKVYSNLEHSMINAAEYSKCSKCFLNNVKLYQETIQTKNLSVWSKFKLLIKEKVYILCCLTISSLYFESTGSQYWMPKIGVIHLKINEKTLFLIFCLISIVGTLSGVLSGSHLIDQIIYHYPQYPLLVDCVIIFWYTTVCIAGVVLIITQTPLMYILSGFIILFFGSSMVSTLTLMSVAYLPHRLKPAGASFFICQYHILGFTLGSLVPGIAVDIFKSYNAALYIIYLSGFAGLGTLLLICYIKWKRIRTAKLTGRSIYIKGAVVI